MKKSVSFSKDDIESTSLNFSELREKGLEYVQELSGDVWTDYNSHDPGVTILEQLCYALTDIGLRTSLPIGELLVPEKDSPVDAEKNAFFAPSAIFSSHPVTIMDMRKMIINQFTEVQNVWITTKKNKGYQEELRGINQIEILPKLNFLNATKSNSDLKNTFLKRVNQFLGENRNLGEIFENTHLLEAQPIQIKFDIYLSENADLETSVANLLLNLFEFIYTPVQYHNMTEMEEEKYRIEEIYSGPRLSNGFIKNNLPDRRLQSIYVDELQKLFSKTTGINKSIVRSIIYRGKAADSLQVDKDKFFHLLSEENSGSMTDKGFETIYSNMNVFVDNKKIPSLNQQNINNLFFETWSKKHRGYSLSTSNDDFEEKLKGTYRNPGNYISIQKHFPLIYGIGAEGISEKESKERHARANQLKAYLVLFEQHLSNHLAQLANLNEFFNISYNKNGENKTFFTQWLSSVPRIENLADKDDYPMESLETESLFFSRKNKIYDHLLARFGEELSDVPWKIGRRLHLIKSEAAYNQKLLQQKSLFLLHLKDVSYERMKGESFQKEEGNKISRKPSGLEQIIAIKTGINIRKNDNESLIPENLSKKSHWKKDEKHITDINRSKYKPLLTDDLALLQEQQENTVLPDVTFGSIGIKKLFAETLNLNNYRIHVPESESEKTSVIFRKEPNEWAQLFTCKNKEEAVQYIRQIMNFFIEQNTQSEGFYIVDHILLNDLLAKSKFGFKFIDYDLENDSGDEDKFNLFQTLEEKAWLKTATERNKLFFNTRLEPENFYYDDGQWMIRHEGDKIFPAQPENSELEKLNNELANGAYCLKKGKWYIKREDGKLDAETDEEKVNLFNKIVEEEVYSKYRFLPPKLNAALEKDAYFYDDNNAAWIIKYNKKILASCKIREQAIKDILANGNYYFEQGEWHSKNEEQLAEPDNDLNALNAAFENVYERTKSIIQLFTLPEETTGRLRFQELEKIRLKGVLSIKNEEYRQRRLVFQQKLWNNEIIDEDFFDMKISVVLPNWPARFQDEQFKAFIKDIILERIPTHISNEILWADATQLKEFEKNYFKWRKLKAEQNLSDESAEELKNAAFAVYQSIMEMKATNKQ